MITAITPIVDEPHHDTWFYKALRWQVHNADDAMDLVSSHRAQAAKARAHILASTDCFHSSQTAALWEGRACNHDEVAAVCERHAARLRATTPYQTVTSRLIDALEALLRTFDDGEDGSGGLHSAVITPEHHARIEALLDRVRI